MHMIDILCKLSIISRKNVVQSEFITRNMVC